MAAMRHLLALPLLLLAANAADAARLAYLRVERSGTLLVQAIRTLPDEEPMPRSWLNLRDAQLETGGKAGADLSAPAEMTLQGDIRISVVWTDKTLAECKTDHLRLIAKNGRWMIPEDEVIRTGMAAGLDMNQANPTPGWIYAGAALIVALVIFGALLIWQWRKNEKLATV